MLHPKKRDVHQGDGSLVLTVDKFAGRLVELIAFLNRISAGVEGYFLDLCKKRGVATVVGPVGVQHPDLGDRRVSLLLIPEVVPTEGEVGH